MLEDFIVFCWSLILITITMVKGPIHNCRTPTSPTEDVRDLKMHAIKWIKINAGFGDMLPTLQWRHNGHDAVSNHQPHNCLLRCLFGPRSMKTSKLRATGLCVENSPGTGEFPAQMASNAENVSIWWRHHGLWLDLSCTPGSWKNSLGGTPWAVGSKPG